MRLPNLQIHITQHCTDGSEVLDPWLPWPLQIKDGTWKGYWREYSVGPGIRNRFWAVYRVMLYRLVGSKLNDRRLIPRWYNWLDRGS